MKSIKPLLASLCLAGVGVAPVQAGRPLATDDAATADVKSCQVEAWLERAGPDRVWVLAPACGVAPGLEISAELIRLQVPAPWRAAAGLGLKWVPAAWQLATPAGEMNLGLKLHTAMAKDVARGWHSSGSSVLLLSSLKLGDALTLHTNLGATRSRLIHSQAALLNLALAWTPAPDWLLFAEAQTNNRQAVFGATLASGGARYWWIKDSLGVDLTASRERAAGGPTLWSLGLGWYGIGL